MNKLSKIFEENRNETYIIAEVSQTHDGSLGQAHAFIDAVAETGADAIKFQTHIAFEESTVDEPFRVKFSYEDKTRYDYWKRMEFTEEQWKELFNHAKEKGLDFLSSPFSRKALRMLDGIGVPAWKFGSGEVFNDFLLEEALLTGKPLIMSTGMSTYKDIDQQIKKIQKKGNDYMLMQCTTAYPCSPEEIGINILEELSERYDVPVGLSDHSASIFPSLAAITLGAKAIEVHVTMSKYMFGPDVSSSVTIEELKTIVEGARFINKMKNNPYDKNKLSDNLYELKSIFSKSIYISKDLNPSDVITKDDIMVKKPGTGIPPSRYKEVIGRKLTVEKRKNTILRWEDLKDVSY